MKTFFVIQNNDNLLGKIVDKSNYYSNYQLNFDTKLLKKGSQKQCVTFLKSLI